MEIKYIIISKDGCSMWSSELNFNFGEVFFNSLEEAIEVREDLNSKYNSVLEICAITKTGY